MTANAMSRVNFAFSVFTIAALFGCIFSSVDCRPQDPPGKDVLPQSQSPINSTTIKPLENSDKDVIKDVTTTSSVRPSVTTTIVTTTSNPRTVATKVSTVKPTTGSTTKRSLTTTKPRTSTPGTTKPTESSKIPSTLPKVPLRADKPDSGSKHPLKGIPGNETDDERTPKENDNVKSFLPDRQSDLGVIPGVGDLSDVDEEDENPTFRLKEPGFGTPKPRPPATTPASTDEDKRIRKEWGGNCLAKHWQYCSHLRRWGGNYYAPDKSDPKKTKLYFKASLDCYGPGEKTYCLRNGWTVVRCHINCMSQQCNRDLSQKWDSYVSHDGPCPLW